MAWRFDEKDVSGFKFLLSLAILYSLMAAFAYSVINMKFVKPLGFDAPLDRFSEARAIEHVRVLSHEIDGRQEGRPGLKEAARYIKTQLETMKERAGPDFRIEIEENVVGGSFNMMFLGYSISLGYRNLTNVIMRISSVDTQDTDPSVLINAHFDSALGSPGAGDCGSCVASVLEIARIVIDSSWVPPKPIIFLFNGAEELFMLGAHGFMKTHNWRHSIGALVNVEASGTGGLDLVCQSGPGSWPSSVYAKSAVYPMAHSAAQDVFPVIPGDTDYRIFSEDYGNIPGLDIIFLWGGYYYHTASDTVDRLLPGSMQARGENLFSVLKAFTNSSKLKNAYERESIAADANGYNDERAVFFDYLTLFMIFYSRRIAVLLHSIPMVIFIATPLLSRLLKFGVGSCVATFADFVKGMVLHAIGIVLAVVFPVLFSILRLLFSSYAMSWSVVFLGSNVFFFLSKPGILFEDLMSPRIPIQLIMLRRESFVEFAWLIEKHYWKWENPCEMIYQDLVYSRPCMRFAAPYLAFFMFVPCSLVGLLIPRVVWSNFPLSQDASVLHMSKEAVSDEARFWGAFGFYASVTLAYLIAGLTGGFLTFSVSVFMLLAWISFSFNKKSARKKSLRSTIFYVLPLIPCLAYGVYFGGFLAQFLIEKMGMMGAVPPPYGYYIPDAVVAVVIGVVTGWCVGPLIPICGSWLARSSILGALLHLSVLALALSSQFFPYSTAAPKRVVLQHTFVTADGNKVLDASYDLSVVDSNSLGFVFKHAPDVARELHIDSESLFEAANISERRNWMALFPVSFLFSRSLKFATNDDEIRKQYPKFPHLSSYKPQMSMDDGKRRVYLELSLGSLEEVWVAVLNITGPLSSWSFADNVLPAPETTDGGPPSYILRLSGASPENWSFWLEAGSSEGIRVDVAVLDQKLVAGPKKLKALFPEWIDVIAYSSFLSSYIL